MNEETARVIASAIAAAGPIGNGNSYDWEQKVIAALPIVATMFDEEGNVGKRAKLFQDAHIYTGLFMDLKLEESSNRAVLRTDAEKTENGEPVIDEIRTDRIDTAIGARIYRSLQTCRPGDSLLLWRVNEPMRNDPKKNVRVLYHAKRLRRADPQSQRSPNAETPVALPAPPPEVERRDTTDPEALTILAAFQALGPDGKAKVAIACREKGVSIGNGLNLDEALIVMQEITNWRNSQGESF